MSASIIPPLPHPSLSLWCSHLASPAVSLSPYGASSRFSATGGWFQPLPPPRCRTMCPRPSLSISLSLSRSHGHPRMPIESFLPTEPTGHAARLFSSHLLCKRTQSRPVTLSPAFFIARRPPLPRQELEYSNCLAGARSQMKDRDESEQVAKGSRRCELSPSTFHRTSVRNGRLK